MNSITTRSIATLAATGTSSDDSQRTEVEQLVHDAIEDGIVTIEEETAIEEAIEDHSELEFESLDEAAPQG